MAEVKTTDIKALLDGDGTAQVDAAPAILETRPGTCPQHGNYTDQKINIRSYSGLSLSLCLTGLAALNVDG